MNGGVDTFPEFRFRLPEDEKPLETIYQICVFEHGTFRPHLPSPH